MHRALYKNCGSNQCTLLIWLLTIWLTRKRATCWPGTDNLLRHSTSLTSWSWKIRQTPLQAWTPWHPTSPISPCWLRPSNPFNSVLAFNVPNYFSTTMKDLHYDGDETPTLKSGVGVSSIPFITVQFQKGILCVTLKTIARLATALATKLMEWTVKNQLVNLLTSHNLVKPF